MTANFLKKPYEKKNCLYVINGILPLFCGFFIYMTVRENTYLSFVFSFLRSRMPVIAYPSLIRNYAADFLWTYALFFCLRLTLGDELSGKRNKRVLFLTAAVSVVVECLQLTGIFPGTFDFWDILVELTAALAALMISNRIEQRRKFYEEK